MNKKYIRVHPRSRGEYGPAQHIVDRIRGSPPPTRGILGYSLDLLFPGRFTPAHAGNTIRTINGDDFSEVHPRPRGEYVLEKL